MDNMTQKNHCCPKRTWREHDPKESLLSKKNLLRTWPKRITFVQKEPVENMTQKNPCCPKRTCWEHGPKVQIWEATNLKARQSWHSWRYTQPMGQFWVLTLPPILLKSGGEGKGGGGVGRDGHFSTHTCKMIVWFKQNGLGPLHLTTAQD